MNNLKTIITNAIISGKKGSDIFRYTKLYIHIIFLQYKKCNSKLSTLNFQKIYLRINLIFIDTNYIVIYYHRFTECIVLSYNIQCTFLYKTCHTYYEKIQQLLYIPPYFLNYSIYSLRYSIINTMFLVTWLAYIIILCLKHFTINCIIIYSYASIVYAKKNVHKFLIFSFK